MRGPGLRCVNAAGLDSVPKLNAWRDVNAGGVIEREGGHLRLFLNDETRFDGAILRQLMHSIRGAGISLGAMLTQNGTQANRQSQRTGR